MTIDEQIIDIFMTTPISEPPSAFALKIKQAVYAEIEKKSFPENDRQNVKAYPDSLVKLSDIQRILND